MTDMRSALDAATNRRCRRSALSLFEVNSSGAAVQYSGTLVVLDVPACKVRSIGVTARHNVVWEEGRIFPAALRAERADGSGVVTLSHLFSSAYHDLSYFEIDWGEEEVEGGSRSGSGGGSSSSSSSPCPGVHLAEPQDMLPGTPLVLYAHPAVAVHHGLASGGQPLRTYGRLSHILPSGDLAVLDYEGFPASSGGAVIIESDGSLAGIHIASVWHSEAEEEEEAEINDVIERDSIVAPGFPRSSGGGAAAELGGADSSGQDNSQVLERLKLIESQIPHKGQIATFVPATILFSCLRRAKLLQKSAIEKGVAANVKAALKRQRRR